MSDKKEAHITDPTCGEKDFRNETSPCWTVFMQGRQEAFFEASKIAMDEAIEEFTAGRFKAARALRLVALELHDKGFHPADPVDSSKGGARQ